MSRRDENTGFDCLHCGARIRPVSNGGYRNHCPFCLCSRHVDDRPGDRAADCGGVMDPIRLRDKPGKGLQIEFRCRVCGTVSVNRIARDTVQPDDLLAILRL
ncbi:RNHCP domain-containing protein [Stackebrandtia albiflava]|uniref:RNHCP domain-containing protein n=1 Tax=Stackebrandtia albiflava TaxID=406432 RepID=A0A562VAK9_9ACTN|nr:RNHCP domain-containing protein [Stackebrandtia albiflava]TWJ14905.1 RNHCP domain-containing protein [Stackebrandtia albiflava]